MPENPEAYGMAGALARMAARALELSAFVALGFGIPWLAIGRPQLAHGYAPAPSPPDVSQPPDKHQFYPYPTSPPPLSPTSTLTSLGSSPPPSSPAKPPPPSSATTAPTPKAKRPATTFDQYDYKPVSYTRLPTPAPELGTLAIDVSVVLRLPNFCWINHRDAHPDSRAEDQHSRQFGKGIRMRGMGGTDLERRLVEGLHRRVHQIGVAKSMRKTRIDQVAAQMAKADKKAQKEQGSEGGEEGGFDADQLGKQDERSAQLGWGNLYLGDYRLRASACEGKVVVLYYDEFAIRILLAQEAKLVAQVSTAESNALLDGGLSLLLPDDVRETYWNDITGGDALYAIPTATRPPRYAPDTRAKPTEVPLAHTIHKPTALTQYLGYKGKRVRFNLPPPFTEADMPALVHPNRGQLGDFGQLFNLAPAGFENCDSVLTPPRPVSEGSGAVNPAAPVPAGSSSARIRCQDRS